MERLIYTVSAQVVNEAYPSAYALATGEDNAVKLARQMCKDHPQAQVYISWHRRSDGQHGFINPDGHAITGHNWSQTGL